MTTSTARPSLRIRAVAAEDEAAWADLFRAYRDFYRLEPNEDVISRVWQWLLDPASEVHGLLATTHDGAVGLAHYRRFARPASGTTGLWLDDLYVAPAARGTGAGRAMIDRLRRTAAVESLSLVRWITAEDNATARALYDSLGTATSWVLYDSTPQA